jgi:hypothetical protein
MTGRRTVLLASRVALVVGALSFPACVQARPQTTRPTSYLTVVVVEYDKFIRMAIYASNSRHNGLVPVGANIPRGDSVSINIFNRGMRLHDFKIFGLKTAPIKPGGKAHLFVVALIRGAYPWGSTLDAGRAFHGFVYVI